VRIAQKSSKSRVSIVIDHLVLPIGTALLPSASFPLSFRRRFELS
jgi:hypothetical protein